MKTLLLSLVMVGFMYLVSGQNRTCRSCTGALCLKIEQCKEGQNLCFERKITDDFFGMKTVRGCADTCANPGENEKVTYCSTDNCNS
uniref:Toxin 3FTx-Dis4 n=1 Tax=Dispholidus typus TaxID=46295 RepID=3NX4_DISTY|nr:RecName: Full=Toxin 3FTx-Dis4; Flags: Precursor [Dispholidus typus]ABU68567.1 3FTx-Dis4 [Dispholidus typus]